MFFLFLSIGPYLVVFGFDGVMNCVEAQYAQIQTMASEKQTTPVARASKQSLECSLDVDESFCHSKPRMIVIQYTLVPLSHFHATVPWCLLHR